MKRENVNSTGQRPPSPRVALLAAMLVFVLYVAYVSTGTGQALYLASKEWLPYDTRQHFGMSKRFMLQYGHVVFLFLLLILSRYIFVSKNRLPAYGPKMQFLNRYSLAIFLFHFPILFFAIAVFNYDSTNLAHQGALLCGTLIVCYLLGRVCFVIKPWFDTKQSKFLGFIDARHPRSPSISVTKPLQITSLHSDLLSLVKLIATLCVVLGHFSFDRFTNLNIPGFPGAAPRFAVPTFFMVSGYFLMMSIDRSKLGASAMLVRRAFSMYYVVIPALFFTLVLDAVGYRVDPSGYEFADYYIAQHRERPYPDGQALGIFVSSALYLNEIWIFNILDVRSHMGGMRAYSNDPFWFMCYLIPFSAILVAYRLLDGIKRYVVMVLLLLVVGPPVLLLAPLFFSGALAYIIHKRLEA